MRKKLLANWGIKLISLLAAFGLWFAVIYIDDPPEEETFSNIKVQFLNTELITDQGLVYEVLDGTDVVRQVTVKGPKTVLGEVNKESIIAIADFSEKNMSDVIDIELSVGAQYENTLEISAVGNAQLKLFVEEKVSKSIPLNVNIIGEVAAEHQLGSAKTDQNRITITGGKSKVERVSYAAVNVDVSGIDTDISTTEVIRLYDKDSNLLETNLVQKNISSTKTTVTVLATKTVPVEYEVTGEPAEGYLLTGDVVCDVESVKIAGTDATLFDVNSIRIPAQELDITGLSDNLVKQVSLKDYLPTGVHLAKDEGNDSAQITAYIEPEVSLDLKVMSENIAIINVPAGWQAEIEESYQVYDLRVHGLNRAVTSIVEADLRGTADVQAWMTEQELEKLRSESYYIPVKMQLPDGVNVSVPVEARVTFSVLEETDELDE